MKNRLTLLGIIVFLITEPVHADIGIITPNNHSNCAPYFDNQSLVFDPAWQANKHPTSMFTIFATYLAKYTIGNFTDEGVEILEFEEPPENNHGCFNGPRLLKADNKGVPNHINVTINTDLKGIQRQLPKLKINTAEKCCSHLYTFQAHSIKA